MVPLSRFGLGVAAVVVAAAALSACSHGPDGASSPRPSNPARTSAVPSASPAAAAAAPMIVGVTTGGALVTLNPATGATEQTLVSSGVTGDEVSVAPDGMVFFTVKNGCGSNIDEIPAGGGTPALVAPGSAPAVSPDGSKLAYASEPHYANASCQVSSPGTDEWFQLEIRTLSTGATVTIAAVPAGQDSGLPHPISHLSWSADNTHVAVSISPPEDNEGWAVNLVDTSQAQFFVAGTGVATVPVAGSPDPQGTFLREAVYMPDGDLFVSRACCQGWPPQSTSSLMWEVSSSGAFVHQVAIGYPNLVHSSLDVSPDGQRLLYVAGSATSGTLYVSDGGATPRELTTGLAAAAWS